MISNTYHQTGGCCWKFDIGSEEDGELVGRFHFRVGPWRLGKHFTTIDVHVPGPPKRRHQLHHSSGPPHTDYLQRHYCFPLHQLFSACNIVAV